MTEVHSNLLGEIVAVTEFKWDRASGVTCRRKALGQVRAVYCTENNLCILVENEEAHENAGRLGMYSLSSNSVLVLVVQQCVYCGAWDRKAYMRLQIISVVPGFLPDVYVHVDGKGCKAKAVVP